MQVSQIYQKAREFLFENKTLNQTLLKNITWLSASEIITRLLTVFLSIYIARKLGAENYGLLAFAISFTSLFSILADFGLEGIIVREINQKREATSELGAILWLKLLLGLFTFCLIIGSAFFIENSISWLMVIIFAGVILIDSITRFLYSIFQAFQKIEYTTVNQIIKTIFLVVAGTIVVYTKQNITFVGYAYLLSSLIAFLIAIFFAKYLSMLPRPGLDINISKKYLYMSWPLALTALFSSIYVQIDSVMMSFWGMIREVGYYQAAYKIINFTTVPGAILFTAFLPALSKAYKQADIHFNKISTSFFELLVFFAFPITVGGFLYGEEIILFLYGIEFEPSILAFQILIFTLIFTLFSIYIIAILTVINHQKYIYYITGSTAMLNIILNIFLIPKFSLYGAAYATLGSYIFLFIFGLIVLTKNKIILNIKVLVIPSISVAIMGTIIYLGIIKDLHLVFQILITGTLYILLFLSMKYGLQKARFL